MHTHDTHSHSHNNDFSSLEEIVAMLKYMTNHNASHTNELLSIADKLKTIDNEEAYTKIMSAIDEYKKGNDYLAQALDSLE